MFVARTYIFAVVFGLICGVLAFIILNGPDKQVGMVLFESAVIALVGAGGYLYGQYTRERQNQKQSKAKMSKKQMKRARKR